MRPSPGHRSSIQVAFLVQVANSSKHRPSLPASGTSRCASMFVTKVPGHSKALQLHTLRQSNIQVPSSEPSNSVLGFGALILGQTGGHLAGGILDRTSLPPASYIVTSLAQPVGRHADHHFGRQSCILIAHALRTLRTSPTDGYLRDYGHVHHAKPLEDRPVGTSVTALERAIHLVHFSPRGTPSFSDIITVGLSNTAFKGWSRLGQ